MYSPDDDDDLLDGDGEDAEEEYLDGEGETVSSSQHSAPSRPVATSRGVKVKPMSARMMKNHPNCVSILITLDDGRQLLFARPR